MMHLRFVPVVALLLLTACASTEAQIKQQIAQANYCETADDCVDIGSKCPFGCYNFVNAKEVDRLKPIVEGYKSNCVYSCIALQGVECRANKCEPIYDAPPAQEKDTEGNVGAACTSHEECVTPMSYLMRSSCPFTSMCIEGACSVVCPQMNPDPAAPASESWSVSCKVDSDCNCNRNGTGSQIYCACVDEKCVGVME